MTEVIIPQPGFYFMTNNGNDTYCQYLLYFNEDKYLWESDYFGALSEPYFSGDWVGSAKMDEDFFTEEAKLILPLEMIR